LVAGAVGRSADALGVAGGDGFLAVVAAAAGTHGLPFVCSRPTLGANVDEVSAEGVDDLLDLDVALRFPVGHEGAQLRAPRADELLVRHAGAGACAGS
jgi:hypothetical protein